MITAAAAIMVVVFLAFVISDDPFVRLIGVGMATGDPGRCDRGEDGSGAGVGRPVREQPVET